MIELLNFSCAILFLLCFVVGVFTIVRYFIDRFKIFYKGLKSIDSKKEGDDDDSY